MPKMKEFDGLEEKTEFPYEYELFRESEIKSPLNLLWYNLLFEYDDDYPAKMNPDFARDMIHLYSKEGQTVWDGCCGSGTAPLVAAKNNRVGIGSDVNPKAIDLARKHASNNHLTQQVQFLVEDARTIRFASKIDLILSSFPFGLNIAGDKNNYSDEPKDISNSKSYDDFYRATEQIIQNYYKVLKPLGIMILDARDRTKDGEYQPLGCKFWQQAERVGFKTLAIYHYMLVPYRLMPHKNKATDFIAPMVSCMDAVIMYKPADSKLDSVLKR